MPMSYHHILDYGLLLGLPGLAPPIITELAVVPDPDVSFVAITIFGPVVQLVPLYSSLNQHF
jgi:hypothetical protein